MLGLNVEGRFKFDVHVNSPFIEATKKCYAFEIAWNFINIRKWYIPIKYVHICSPLLDVP